MSYFISEDMKPEDFDTVLDLLEDWCSCLNPEYDEPDDKEYTEYRIERRKELAEPIKTFCKIAKEKIAELETFVEGN